MFFTGSATGVQPAHVDPGGGGGGGVGHFRSRHFALPNSISSPNACARDGTPTRRRSCIRFGIKTIVFSCPVRVCLAVSHLAWYHNIMLLYTTSSRNAGYSDGRFDSTTAVELFNYYIISVPTYLRDVRSNIVT